LDINNWTDFDILFNINKWTDYDIHFNINQWTVLKNFFFCWKIGIDNRRRRKQYAF
jgi:hypothetical protein